MFIAILTYRKPLEEVDRFLQAHRDYLAEHYAAGDFIASGPQHPQNPSETLAAIPRIY